MTEAKDEDRRITLLSRIGSVFAPAFGTTYDDAGALGSPRASPGFVPIRLPPFLTQPSARG